jgi:hypothetical protein
MFERFTDAARQVVVAARQEAKGLRHDCVGTAGGGGRTGLSPAPVGPAVGRRSCRGLVYEA